MAYKGEKAQGCTDHSSFVGQKVSVAKMHGGEGCEDKRHKGTIQ